MSLLDFNNISAYQNGDSDRHVLTLYAITLSSKAKIAIELGVRNCSTTKPILEAIKYQNGILHSVDIVEPDNINTLGPNLRFHKKDAIEFLLWYEENLENFGYPDLIYIDDWHEYNHVKKELEIIDRICTPNTIILIHDLMYGNTCPYYHMDLTVKDGQWGNGGPYRAVAELDIQFWEFATLPYNNGLTLLRKKYSSKYNTINS